MTAPALPSLSSEFIGRLLRFVEWQADWDGLGADRISSQTALMAAEIAQRSLAVAPEPVVAPCGDGSLLLIWQLAPELEVELFVLAPEEPAVAVLDRAGRIFEEPIHDVDGLLQLLANPRE